jgi:catechol 2,3-dioxygenase-like lactoylglutathione lyase family enzyme
MRARRILRLGLTSADADRLAEFYVAAFAARHLASEHLSGAQFERETGVSGGALRHTLNVGGESVDILQFDTPGRSYPHPLPPDDTTFQHFAIVVSDMDRAWARLQRIQGWMPISIGGPQRLPRSSGGVTAFKFRDPEGHPLELLAFPEQGVPPHWRTRMAQPEPKPLGDGRSSLQPVEPSSDGKSGLQPVEPSSDGKSGLQPVEPSSDGIFLGIDHSAISVRDTVISRDFYRALGFDVTAHTLNQGAAQANLDGVPSPEVEVTALSLHASTPHLELLCYRSVARPRGRTLAGNDVAATRVVLAAEGLANEADAARQLIIDPDGHHLILSRDSAGAPSTRIR